jgi:hypothetical protein
VLVLPNLYGDIVSDLGAGLVGGLGVAPGGNIGDEAAVFEPTHGSAPKYAGQNKVNPMAMMLSGVLMLHHLEEMEAAEMLETAIASVIEEGKDVTYDMKPHRDDPTAVGTSEVADAIVRGGFYASGQACISVQRLLVVESVREALLARRVFAVTGDKIDARLLLNDAWIGSSIRAPQRRHHRERLYRRQRREYGQSP